VRLSVDGRGCFREPPHHSALANRATGEPGEGRNRSDLKQ